MRLPEIELADGSFQVDQEKTDAMLRHAYELGVNYFDTALFYCHENSEIAVGKALKPIRDRVYISTKCPLERVSCTADYRKTLELSLKKLDTPYVDFYHFWGINKKAFDEKIVPLGLLEEAEKLKAEGKIRHISFSFHDEPASLKYIIDNGPQLESVLLQYNLLDRCQRGDDPIRRLQGRRRGGHGSGGRRPSGRPDGAGQEARRQEPEHLRAGPALRAGHPGVCCALSGMQTYEMVDQNAAVASLKTP